MIGCRKNMYYIKDTKSRLFTEAYFVLRCGTEMHHISENDLAAEADRILRERFPVGRKRILTPRRIQTITFAVGAVLGGGLMWFIG